jgi:transposase
MNEQLFTIALSISEPVFIEEISFNKTEGELHIYLNFRRGGRFACPECGAASPAADTTEKTWRHLNFFQYKCFLHMRTPRVECPEHGVRLWNPPWARSKSGFTLLFEAFVMQLAKAMPVSQIADLVGEHDTRIWRIIKAYVSKAYAEKDLSGLEEVGVDETSSRKGHRYVTVFADTYGGDVVFATPGKDASTIAAFAEELPKHGGNTEKITEITMDMSQSFITGAADHLPNASVTFDKFHVVKLLNEALDEVRRDEQKVNPLLKKTRYIWLKNPENLTAKQLQSLGSLRKENLKTARAYQMKLTFQDIYREIRNPEEAGIAIKKWLSWAVRSRLDPIKKFARTVKKHYDGILRHFESGLTSGFMEGINSRIQEVKRRARGFRNIYNFISMIYLVAGGLIIE